MFNSDCKTGFWGPSCDRECGQCNPKSCIKSDGYCQSMYFYTLFYRLWKFIEIKMFNARTHTHTHTHNDNNNDDDDDDDDDDGTGNCFVYNSIMTSFILWKWIKRTSLA